MTCVRGRKTPALSTLAFLGLCAAAGAAGLEDCPAIDVPAPAPRVRVFVDPSTGRLREPTADQLRELAEARLKSRAAKPQPVFEVVTHADGMKTVDLGDAFLFDVRVEKLPDGSTTTTCVPHATPAAAPAQK